MFNSRALELEAAKAAFEHLKVTVEDMMAEGNKIAVRFTVSGIHKATFMAPQPTDKPITMTRIEIFRIENGKIAELWDETNLLGLIQQVGVIQTSAQHD